MKRVNAKRIPKDLDLSQKRTEDEEILVNVAVYLIFIKQQSSEWRSKYESRPKKSNTLKALKAHLAEANNKC